jgi:hypothetical protein
MYYKEKQSGSFELVFKRDAQGNRRNSIQDSVFLRFTARMQPLRISYRGSIGLCEWLYESNDNLRRLFPGNSNRWGLGTDEGDSVLVKSVGLLDFGDIDWAEEVLGTVGILRPNCVCVETSLRDADSRGWEKVVEKYALDSVVSSE